MAIADTPERYRDKVKRRWIAAGRPHMTAFAPYNCFVFRANMLYSVADAHGLLPDRATNNIDLQYLHYLPFCRVFTSNDKLHDLIAPHLLRSDQYYLKATDLKVSLANLIEYYARFEDELRAQGRMRFARYLPLDLETSLHAAYDHVMPDWRARAAEPPEPPMTKEDRERLMKQMRPMIEAIQRQSGRKG